MPNPARRANLRAKGLCPRCGARPPAEGSWACAGCLVKHRAVMANREANLAAEGICINCLSAPRVGTHTTCDACRIAANARSKAKRDRFIAAGMCSRCGTNPLATKNHCRGCADKKSQYETNGRQKSGKQARVVRVKKIRPVPERVQVEHSSRIELKIVLGRLDKSSWGHWIIRRATAHLTGQHASPDPDLSSVGEWFKAYAVGRAFEWRKTG